MLLLLLLFTVVVVATTTVVAVEKEVVECLALHLLQVSVQLLRVLLVLRDLDVAPPVRTVEAPVADPNALVP